MSKQTCPPGTESGQALLAVVLLLAIILILGAATLTLASSAKRVAIMQEHRTQAFYTTDAGVERAVAKLATAPEWRDSAGGVLAGSYPNKNGEIEWVKVVDAAHQPVIGRRVVITSQGRFRNACKKLTVNAWIVNAADLFHGMSIVPPEPVSAGLGGVLVVDGFGGRGVLVLNGDLDFQGASARLDADLYASGEVIGPGQVTGRREEKRLVPSFPAVDGELFRPAIVERFGDTTIGEPDPDPDYQVDIDILHIERNGIYFVHGDVAVSGNYSVPGSGHRHRRRGHRDSRQPAEGRRRRSISAHADRPGGRGRPGG